MFFLKKLVFGTVAGTHAVRERPPPAWAHRVALGGDQFRSSECSGGSRSII